MGTPKRKKRTTGATVRALDLGPVSGEQDLRLNQYYFSEWPPYQKAISFENRAFFLLGRTGAGKSGVLQHIRLSYKDSHDVLVVDVVPDEFFLTKHQYLAEIQALADASPHKEFAYKLLWSLVIAGECLRALERTGKNTEAAIPKVTKNVAYRFMKDAGLLDPSKLKITDRILRLIGKIKATVKVKSVEATLEASVGSADSGAQQNGAETIHALLRDCRDILDEVIPDLLGLRRMYVLIDDLDVGWTNNDTSNLLVRSLAQCLIRFSQAEKIKPLASVRTNIFLEIGLYQTEKITDYLIECYWNPEFVGKVIESRLGVVYGIPYNDAWQRFFDDRISTPYEKKTKTFDYLFNRTLGRPRDILQLVGECLKEAEKSGHKKITKDDIESAVSSFSHLRQKALAEEWRHNFPGLERVFRLFARAANGELKTKYDFEEIWDLLADGHKSFWHETDMNWFISLINVDDVTPLVRKLFELGIIGIKESSRSPLRWSHEVDADKVKISGRSTFVVSPCFAPHIESLLPVM